MLVCRRSGILSPKTECQWMKRKKIPSSLITSRFSKLNPCIYIYYIYWNGASEYRPHLVVICSIWMKIWYPRIYTWIYSSIYQVIFYLVLPKKGHPRKDTCMCDVWSRIRHNFAGKTRTSPFCVYIFFLNPFGSKILYLQWTYALMATSINIHTNEPCDKKKKNWPIEMPKVYYE